MVINKVYLDYFNKCEKQGDTVVLQGGRRSGKTYAIAQYLLLKAYFDKNIINIATMTNEQGRLGVFADMSNIINGEPRLQKKITINNIPREFRGANGSRIFFNSYQNSETAKGVSCDYLFVNELNNFTKQQFTDLIVNVRKGIFVDFNPVNNFWASEYFNKDKILKTTWKDNPFLTELQKKEFEKLKENAFREGASGGDMWRYKVYYLGEYGGDVGEYFNLDNLKIVNRSKQHDTDAAQCECTVFIDPSGLSGNDFTAMACGYFSENNLNIVDVFSINRGTKDDVKNVLSSWIKCHNVKDVFVETNGQVGGDMYNFLRSSEIAYSTSVKFWHSQGAKKERILKNYEYITNRVVFLDDNSKIFSNFVSQICGFGVKSQHDDNIDCINSLIDIYKFNKLF